MRHLAKYLTLMVLLAAAIGIGLQLHQAKAMAQAAQLQSQTLRDSNAELQDLINEKEQSAARLADQVNQLNEGLAREVELRKTAETKVLELSAAQPQKEAVVQIASAVPTEAIQPKTQEASLRKPVVAAAASDSSVWMDYKASFYNDSGITKSGRHTQSGVTIAVDPTIIPLGTWVEIKFPDGHVETRRADDTGGKVHGKKIDVYMPLSSSTLMQMGLQSVQIKIVKAKVS